MGYARFAATTSGVDVGLWRPTDAGETVVLLGGTPESWASAVTSSLPRTLVDEGLWVVTVDTPGWGNWDDLDRIDTALAWAAGRGAATDTVIVAAYSDGAVAALNWALRNHEKAAGVALVSPVVDLDERYDRVIGDQASLEAAYPQVGVDIPGTSGSYASCPDSAALDVTGDIDLRVDVAMDDWTPAAFTTLIGKNGAANERSFQLGILTTGVLQFRWYVDGQATTLTANSTANLSGLAAGERRAVRVTMDVDNGSGQRVINFYTSTTGVAGTWTQLGSTVTAAGTTSIFAGTSPLEIGSHDLGTGNLLAGDVYAAEVRDGIAGTTVANPDFADQTPGTTTFADLAGNTWAVHGSAAITTGTATAATFAAHMPSWNPGYLHRRNMVLHMLGDRTAMWWSTADTNTPAAVTAELAAAFDAATDQTLAAETPTAAEWAGVAGDVAGMVGWGQTDARAREVLLRAWMDESPRNYGWKGGDGYYGTTITVSGSTWEVYCSADNVVGTIDQDGTYGSSASVFRNAILRVSDAGVVSQVYGAGNTAPLTPATPGNWYWPFGVVAENGLLRFTCLELSSGGVFGVHEDNVIVTVDPTTWAQTAAVGLGYTTNQIQAPFRDGDWIYILANAQSIADPGDFHTITVESFLARVPYGSMTTAGAWEHWDGDNWTDSVADAAPLVDTTGAAIDGSVCMRRCPAGFAIAAMTAYEGAIRLYRSPWPWGPFTLYETVTEPRTGSVQYGSEGVGYQLCWLSHLDPSGAELMLVWSGNYFDAPTTGQADRDADWYRPHHIVVPAPTYP